MDIFLSVAVIIIVAAAVGGAAAKIIIDKKRGKGSCSCGSSCSSCPMGGTCGATKKSK